MHPKEVAKHNARRQLLKALEHLRETRQKLNLVYDHLYLIKGVPDCEMHCEVFAAYVGVLSEQLNITFNEGVDLAHSLQDMMENPEATPPPIEGRFLRYGDLTRFQRHLVREGHEEIAEHSKDHIPPRYYDHPQNPPPRKPPKILTDLNPPKLKPKPKRKLRDDIPL